MKRLMCVLLTLLVLGCGRGPQGGPGPRGLTGQAGEVGATGAPGSSCSVSSVTASDVVPNGGSLITCGDGSQSLVLNGTDGQNGVAGTPGTLVTPVQLCSKQGSPSYGNWPEYGFCIDNSLYALFEDSKGNLEITVLSSGTFVDSANNTSCTLTVNGCTVTQD